MSRKQRGSKKQNRSSQRGGPSGQRGGGHSGPRGGGSGRSPDRRPGRDHGRGPRKPTRISALPLIATVDRNRKGFAFLIFDDRRFEDMFVSANNSRSLFHGDRVSVRMRPDGSIASMDLKERRFQEFYGRFRRTPGAGFVTLNRKKIEEEIFVSKIGPEFSTLKTGQWVRAKLVSHERGAHAFTAEIQEVLSGEDGKLPPSADLPMISSEFGLIEKHTAEAVEQAQRLRFDEDLKAGRRDLRNVPFITIDGETARDFDDAVYVERHRSGYRLWVAIADVSHYVSEGTALDRDALARATSVYFPERAFHMLPRELSENLCSLRPNEPRLAMGCTIDFDREGQPGDIDVFNCLIQSRRRATYTEIYAESQRQATKTGYDPQWEFTPHFELYRSLRKARMARGSIDFDLPEAELVVAPTGEVQSIKLRERNDAHMLIEEFMIAANEAVTRWALEKQLPFVYRVHELPSAEAIQRFFALCRNFNVQVPAPKGGEAMADLNPKAFQQLLKEIAKSPAAELLNLGFLRSMKQARYTSEHGSHFGLASEAYTHFTSPIRRYPDLIVHRMLKRALKGGIPPAERGEIEKKLELDMLHCNYRERLASEAERESIRLKQVRVMTDHLGEEFDGEVGGMTTTGMFIRLKDQYIEGRVAYELIPGDSYEFLEEKMIVRGRRTKKTFRIGDPVRIQVAAADLERRMIDFALVGLEGAKTEPRRHQVQQAPKDPEDQATRSSRPGRRGRRGRRGSARST